MKKCSLAAEAARPLQEGSFGRNLTIPGTRKYLPWTQTQIFSNHQSVLGRWPDTAAVNGVAEELELADKELALGRIEGM